MPRTRASGPGSGPAPQAEQQFLPLLERLRRHGRVYFRHLPGPDREEALQEMAALGWRWHLRLVRRGKSALAFPAAFATFAARAVATGRRLCGQEPARDALSRAAQRHHGFTTRRLPGGDGALAGALGENARTPVPDQVAFRLDFPRWRRARPARDRRLLDRMMAGDRTLELARRFGLSPARVSQLRREFHADWVRFTADPAPA